MMLTYRCCKCKQLKESVYFSKDRSQPSGLAKRCKQCDSDVRREYRTKHRDEERSRNRKYYHDNKTKLMEQQRVRRRENKAVYNRYKQNRRARQRRLPNTLTAQQVEEILKVFGNRCALSGDIDIELDHFIAISTGKGGTTRKNIIPLSRKLNASKGNKHPLQWFDENKERFGLSEDRMQAIIYYLANLNNKTTEEYVEYVNRCYAV